MKALRHKTTKQWAHITNSCWVAWSSVPWIVPDERTIEDIAKKYAMPDLSDVYELVEIEVKVKGEAGYYHDDYIEATLLAKDSLKKIDFQKEYMQTPVEDKGEEYYRGLDKR